ncbi:MAG: DUF1674 domain-containing protein [Hyphomicrobiales bacterium]
MTDEIKYTEVKLPSHLTELEKLGAAKGKKISAVAEQAIREAAERRKSIDNVAEDMEKEYDGRKKGLEPTRYSDWENKGITSDF